MCHVGHIDRNGARLPLDDHWWCTAGTATADNVTTAATATTTTIHHHVTALTHLTTTTGTGTGTIISRRANRSGSEMVVRSGRVRRR